MLTLSRKAGEDIIIGGNIVVRIARISGDKVRVCIDAPRNVPVDRREVFERRAQAAAATPAIPAEPAKAVVA